MNIKEIVTALSLITIILISVVWKAELEYKRDLLSNKVVIPKPTINDEEDKYVDSTNTVGRTYQTNGRGWMHACREGIVFGYRARWNK